VATWSQVSGPGTVIFEDADDIDTTASFFAKGLYTLRLTANDGALSDSDDVVVNVMWLNYLPFLRAGLK
jgi:hypothetical protein